MRGCNWSHPIYTIFGADLKPSGGISRQPYHQWKTRGGRPLLLINGSNKCRSVPNSPRGRWIITSMSMEMEIETLMTTTMSSLGQLCPITHSSVRSSPGPISPTHSCCGRMNVNATMMSKPYSQTQNCTAVMAAMPL